MFVTKQNVRQGKCRFRMPFSNSAGRALRSRGELLDALALQLQRTVTGHDKQVVSVVLVDHAVPVRAGRGGAGRDQSQ